MIGSLQSHRKTRVQTQLLPVKAACFIPSSVSANCDFHPIHVWTRFSGRSQKESPDLFLFSSLELQGIKRWIVSPSCNLLE